ncbi:MAG: sigma 54-interacting transcriptional regulator [Planctomycetota bacterium]
MQNGAFERVGGNQLLAVDVCIIAATNRPLEQAVAGRQFREDLFYRLNVVAIKTIPLRERVEDVPVLATRYLAELAARHGMPMCALSQAAVEVLQRYAWPGNVRELENVLERAVMFSSGDQIDPDALSGLMVGGSPGEPPVTGSIAQMAVAANRGIVSPTPLPGVYRVEPKMAPDAEAPAEGRAQQADPGTAEEWPTLADVERMHLERTLAATMQNKSLAAKMLGIDRSVLRRKLQRYGLDDSGGE